VSNGVLLKTSITKIAQGCQGGTHQILKANISYYHNLEENYVLILLDGHTLILKAVFLDYHGSGMLEKKPKYLWDMGKRDKK